MDFVAWFFNSLTFWVIFLSQNCDLELLERIGLNQFLTFSVLASSGHDTKTEYERA